MAAARAASGSWFSLRASIAVANSKSPTSSRVASRQTDHPVAGLVSHPNQRTLPGKDLPVGGRQDDIGRVPERRHGHVEAEHVDDLFLNDPVDARHYAKEIPHGIRLLFPPTRAPPIWPYYRQPGHLFIKKGERVPVAIVEHPRPRRHAIAKNPLLDRPLLPRELRGATGNGRAHHRDRQHRPQHVLPPSKSVVDGPARKLPLAGLASICVRG